MLYTRQILDFDKKTFMLKLTLISKFWVYLKYIGASLFRN